MHLFIAKIENDFATLNEAESQHCVKVLRLSVGDKILISDGQGRLCEAELTVVNSKLCEAKIVREIGVFKRPYHLHIACAPTKSIERFEWFLEKATEIGIDEITPIITEHSERTVVKKDRSERVIVAAVKQCQIPNLPTIHEIKKVSEFIAGADLQSVPLKFICYCGNEFEKQNLVGAMHASPLQSSICILIGPEGDFSAKEVALAIENGFIPVTLGETRLRTETAAIVAVHTVSLTLQP
jgi:16S rRNA (uracil1498-N3)-methyltransferase